MVNFRNKWVNNHPPAKHLINCGNPTRINNINEVKKIILLLYTKHERGTRHATT